jgi:hypothetical protein
MGYVTCDVGDQITQSVPGSIPLGTTMTPGQWAISASSLYVLIFQTDGNLVLYQVIGAPPVANSSFTAFAIWDTQTQGESCTKFCVQSDSNLVVYDALGIWWWNSGTKGTNADHLAVQDDGNLVLYTSDGTPVWSTGSNHNQVWPKSGWVTLQSSTVTGSSPCVLTAASDGSLTISALDGPSPSQLWQLAPDGRVLSALLGGQVLTAGTVSNGAAPVTNANQVLPGDSNQVWMCSSELNAVSIWNLGTNLFLCPATSQAGASVEAAAIDDPQQWYMVPANPLEAVMALQAANPSFPAFTSDGQNVYDYINAQLKLTALGETLRGEYSNRNAPLSSYQTYVSDSSNFSSFPDSVWQPVTLQLNDELTAAIAVQKLFTNYRTFYSGMMADKDSLLTELGTDAGFETNEKTGVGGVILAVLSSIIYTVLSAEGPEAAVVANVIQSAVNIGVAANGGHTISASPFQVAYADLWGQLSASFTALESTIGDIEQAILSDWTKLSTTYPLTVSSAPNGLAWPATADQAMITAATQGFIVSVMQILLPAKYRIYEYASTNSNDPDVPGDYTNAPDWAKYESGNTNGYYRYYWIADNADSSACPSQDAMNHLWDNGVAQNDFYAGNNGWALPKSILGDFGASLLAVAVTNLTPNMLTTQGSCTNGVLQSPATAMLAPYSTILMLGYNNTVSPMELAVSMYNPSNGNALFGKISALQTVSFLSKGTVSVLSQSSAGNYSLTTAIACQPSVQTHYSGSVQVSVAFAC